MPEQAPTTMSNIDAGRVTSRAGRRLKAPEWGALLLFLLAEIVFFSFNSPYFLTWPNGVNIVTALSITGILAAGGTILLIAGQFDLSVGSGTAFVALSFALAAQSLGIIPAVGIALLVGVGIGVLNGFLVTVVGVNALITTLGTLAIFRGLTLSIGGASSVRVTGFDWAIARPFFDIPMSAIVFLLIALVVAVVLSRTIFGRTIYAIGANENAARLVGIRTKRTLFFAFVTPISLEVTSGVFNGKVARWRCQVQFIFIGFVRI